MTQARDDSWNALARQAVDSVWRSAGARFEGLGVSRAELLEATVSRTLARFARAGRPLDEAGFRSAVERALLGDLALALAWERGSEDAWQLYESEFEDAVIAAARRQGAAPGEARRFLEDLQRLSLEFPPAPEIWAYVESAPAHRSADAAWSGVASALEALGAPATVALLRSRESDDDRDRRAAWVVA